jgi:hypothetical protein
MNFSLVVGQHGQQAHACTDHGQLHAPTMASMP